MLLGGEYWWVRTTAQINGGKFKRFNPMENWYLADYLRLEAACGVSRLDRFNLKGTMQFFQIRLQFEF